MEHPSVASVYCEFDPSVELRDYVRAIAWWGPAGVTIGDRAPTRETRVTGGDDTLTPSFADASTSILFPLGVAYSRGKWQSCDPAEATVMGAMTRATLPPGGPRPAMLAVYLKPRGATALLGVPAAELTDRVVTLSDVWTRFMLAPERATLENLELILRRRLYDARISQSAAKIADLASRVRRANGRTSVERMADLAGLSRQHLGRLFREHVGVSPKLYLRLARFRGALRLFGERGAVGGWSGLAARLGYADQSHLIAHCREFTSFTPAQLARGDRFHPFIDETARNDDG